MDITLLVGTCDRYSFLWQNFCILFDRYWDKSINIDKYFVSETIPCNEYGFKTILPGKIPYSDCLKYAISFVNTKYILWMQDDYFLQKTIDKSIFQYYMSIINNGIDRFGIHEDSEFYSKTHVINDIYRIQQNSLYTISMQASIWNKDFFKSCLIESGSENPWEFEINGSQRLNSSKIHNILFDKQQEPWYKEAMRKGQFTQDYYSILEKERLI